MKIKRISCDQFAGLRGIDLSFSDGVNVLYGKNESGKSTVVSLISGTLFQDAKLGKQVNNGGAFADKFLTVKKDGTKNASIDGKIQFATKNGDFTLSKDWGNSMVKLITPDDLSTDQEDVNAVLEKELGYGKGVYSELLFSPQRA